MSKKIMTTAEYNEIQRRNDRRHAEEAGEVIGYYDTLAEREGAISQHKCEGFYIMVKAAYRDYAYGLHFTKQELLDLAWVLLYPSRVRAGGEFKREEKGKLCYRFKVDVLRAIAINRRRDDREAEERGELVTPTVDIIPLGKSWKQWAEETRQTALRHNAGCGAEKMLCERFGWRQIGELDNQSHVHHCDAVDANGKQIEIKLENGYIRNQFWRKGWDWI